MTARRSPHLSMPYVKKCSIASVILRNFLQHMTLSCFTSDELSTKQLFGSNLTNQNQTYHCLKSVVGQWSQTSCVLCWWPELQSQLCVPSSWCVDVKHRDAYLLSAHVTRTIWDAPSVAHVAKNVKTPTTLSHKMMMIHQTKNIEHRSFVFFFNNSHTVTFWRC